MALYNSTFIAVSTASLTTPFLYPLCQYDFLATGEQSKNSFHDLIIHLRGNYKLFDGALIIMLRLLIQGL